MMRVRKYEGELEKKRRWGDWGARRGRRGRTGAKECEPTVK